MKRTIKQQFLAALKSGLYKKINGYLKTSDGNCANGVLCEIVDPTWTLRSYVGTHNENVYKHRNKCPFSPDTNVNMITGLSQDEMCQIEKLNDKNETWKPVIEFVESLAEED